MAQVYNMNQAEVIRCGGVDAAMYMNILQMGASKIGGLVKWLGGSLG